MSRTVTDLPMYFPAASEHAGSRQCCVASESKTIARSRSSTLVAARSCVKWIEPVRS